MQLTRKIVHYPQATLADLDAGVCVAYPLPNGQYKYYAVPSFLIIGAQKCGTSELQNWLGRHPQLRAFHRKEVHFFDETWDITTEWPRYVLNPFFIILQGTSSLSPHQDLYTFEKTASYFDAYNSKKPAAALVQQMLPSGKFIVLLRNPTARAYSAYQMFKRTRRPAYQEYLDNDFTTLVKRALANQKQGIPSPLLHVGHYAQHLRTWWQYFKPEQLLILLLDDFIADPFSTLNRVLRFVNLPDFDYEPLAHKNPRGFWVLRKGYPSKGNNPPYDPIPPAAKELLDAYYAPWNVQLKQLLPGLSFNW